MMQAKMKVDSVEAVGSSQRVKMSAVTGGTNEDNSYATATPTASVDMQIDNPSLSGKIKVGQKFYVNFSLAEDVAEANVT